MTTKVKRPIRQVWSRVKAQCRAALRRHLGRILGASIIHTDTFIAGFVVADRENCWMSAGRTVRTALPVDLIVSAHKRRHRPRVAGQTRATSQCDMTRNQPKRVPWSKILNSWPTFSPYLCNRVWSELTCCNSLSHSRLASSRLNAHIEPSVNNPRRQTRPIHCHELS